MTRYTLTILEEQRSTLQASLLRDGREYGALMLCGRSRHIDPWTGEMEERFLAHQVIDIEEAAFIDRTPTSMTWSTTPFYNAVKKSEMWGLAVAALHSHPSGPLAFSTADDLADQELFPIAFDRLENVRPHLAIVMDGSGRLAARAYESDLKPATVSAIRVVGERWLIAADGKETPGSDREYDRQARAFGPALAGILASLRVGIVGCGGTGSAAATLLARIGVGHLALFDADRVDETSLNRMHFSIRADASLARSKVDVVAEGIARLGLRTSVRAFSYFVNDERCRDALRSCDLIFGCTDDHLGRNFLNRLAHFYLIPVVDLGLLIDPNDEGGYHTFDGRVTVVQPGYPCQLCRRLIRPNDMWEEHLRRNDPVLHQQHRRAGYITGGREPSPAVVTFTTEVATMAVNELLQRLTGFRGQHGAASERVRRFDEVKEADTLPGGSRGSACPICQKRKYDGVGDVAPFLDQA